MHDDSGLMLLGHRYYDASTGRFLSRDPVGDGSNWYVYCGNNPLKFTDPLGLFDVYVKGDTKGVRFQGVAFWWTMGRHISEDDHFFDTSKVENTELVKRYILVAMIYGDSFYYFGHGTTNGDLDLGNNVKITEEDLEWVANERKRRNKEKMNNAACFSCFSGRLASFINAWLAIADEFSGYPDVTASEYPLRLNPVQTWTAKVKVDPGPPLGNKSTNEKKDEADKNRKRVEKGLSY